MPVRILSALILGLVAINAYFAQPQRACAALEGGSTGGSGSIAGQTCDTQVWKTMEARARIETEREIMQNQNLIFKPDSVLQYVCFDSMAAHASLNVGNIFTHTTYFTSTPVIARGSAESVDKALQNVVILSLRPYLTENFGHAALGGRGVEYKKSGGDGYLKVPANIGPSDGQYSCGEMAKVWAMAKCANFMHTENLKKQDGYYPFKDLTAVSGGENVKGYTSIVETRKNYPPGSDCSSPAFIGSTWAQEIKTSRNEDAGGRFDGSYKYETPNKEAFQAVRTKVEPNNCSPAIKTGVTIVLGPGTTATYPDGVCTNPGCTYVRGGGGGSCVGSGTNVSNTGIIPGGT